MANTTINRSVKFLVVLCLTTAINSILWEYVAGDLYDCTDSLVGYWTPGDWVHSWPDHPVIQVSHVVHGRAMSESDSIKVGWSVTKLWALWTLFVAISVSVSIALARVRWLRHQ